VWNIGQCSVCSRDPVARSRHTIFADEQTGLCQARDPLSVITLSVGESFGLRRLSKPTPLAECLATE
jgi:hypothetical protein